MTDQPKTKPPAASLDDVRRLVGDIDPETVLAIVETKANLGEVEQALSCANANECKWPLEGRVAAIYDILMSDPAFADSETE